MAEYLVATHILPRKLWLPGIHNKNSKCPAITFKLPNSCYHSRVTFGFYARPPDLSLIAK
jgi:hypothetical protein